MDFIFGIITGAGAAGLCFVAFNVSRAAKLDELEQAIRKDYAAKYEKLKAAEQKVRRAVKR